MPAPAPTSVQSRSWAPLNTAKLGWIYVYRSAGLTETVTQDYVSFDYATSVFTTPIYKLGFFIKYLGGNRLEPTAVASMYWIAPSSGSRRPDTIRTPKRSWNSTSRNQDPR